MDLGTTTSFKTPSLNLNVSSSYLVTLEAINGAGLHREIETQVNIYDSEIVYSGVVAIAINYARVENVSGFIEDPEMLANIDDDFTCLLETDVIGVEFPAPTDPSSVDKERYIDGKKILLSFFYNIIY